MVLRSAFAHLLTKSRNLYRPLLAQPQPFTRLLMRTQPSSNIKPHAGFFEEPKSLLFHPDNIMKHKEVIPILLITVVGFTCEMLYTLRQALTRDDVWYTKGKAACEVVETRTGPMYKAPIRKVIPVLVVTIGGVIGCALWCLRAFCTRDDIRFPFKMACEYLDLNKPPPIRKAWVINQKYEYPKGLKDAIQGVES